MYVGLKMQLPLKINITSENSNLFNVGPSIQGGCL